jgi:WD repeat-containing protein 23
MIPPDTALRRNRDFPHLVSATQYFTLHLYDVAHSRVTPKRPRPSLSPTTSPRATARGQMPGTLGDMVMDDEEDEDEDMDMPWGSWTTGRRGMAREETSLKMIKTVQGEEGVSADRNNSGVVLNGD